MKKILFIGDCGDFKETSNGVSAKNVQLLDRLNDMFTSVKHVNTNNWKKNPLVLLNVVFFLWRFRKREIIISLNTVSSYKLIKVSRFLFPSVRFIYFVVGGILPNFISRMGVRQRECYSVVKWFLVESIAMKQNMELLGYDNVIYVPNFKRISYIPTKTATLSSRFKFVFLSRIIPEKGCDLIIDAVRKINKEIGDEKLLVHFYGKIDDSYKTRFLKSVNGIANIEYKGFLNLADKSNYDVLASYSAMLFPTFWKGEGFPGVLIDAMIAGTPVIASQWGYNTEIIHDGENGMIVKSEDVDSLVDAMKYFVNTPQVVEIMSRHCQQNASVYDTAKVLNAELLNRLFKNDNE